MIVTCPTCSRKYSVHSESIGSGRMVRCAVCKTTWQPEIETSPRKDHSGLLQWTFFIITLLGSVLYLAFFTPHLQKIPYYIDYIMESSDYLRQYRKYPLKINNISHEFSRHSDGLYISISGQIDNVSRNNVKSSDLFINIRSDPGEKAVGYIESESFINETWTEKLDLEKVDSDDKIIFKTTERKIPEHNLVCTISFGKEP